MHKHISANINDLKNLWHAVFGDAPSIIDAYFDTFYSPELVACEYADEKLAAAAYVMPAGELVNGDKREKCAHIYAVAVYPEYRGRGFGVAVTNRAVELAKKAGYTAVVLHPATERLFDYYEKHCGFEPCFCEKRTELTLPASENDFPCAEIGAYIACREKLLGNTPHVALSENVLNFFVKCGGKLLVSDSGCAAVEIYDGVAYFREALGEFSQFISGNAVVSTPGNETPTGMIHGAAPFKKGWLGLTLE